MTKPKATPPKRLHLFLDDREIDIATLTTEETTTMPNDPTIQITRLRIQNFRGIASLDVPVGPGGTMTMFCCGGPRPGDCTTPGCATRAATKCKYELRDGRTCDKLLCARHTGTGEADGMCPPHARMVQKAKLFP